MRYLLTLVATFAGLASSCGVAAPPITALAYAPEGKLLLVGTYGRVDVLNPERQEIVTTLTGSRQRVTQITFSHDGKQLAVTSGEPGKSGWIQLYTWPLPQDGKPRVAFLGHNDIIYAAAFNPHSQHLATAGYDRAINVWDTSRPEAPTEPLQTLRDHSDTIYAIAFHPEGKLLASAAADRAVKVWDCATGKRLYTLADATDWLYALSWHPNGKYLAAGGADKSIRVWEISTESGKLVHSVFAHEEAVSGLIYSRDGKILYSRSEGKSLKAWDTQTMKEKQVFPAQVDTLLSLALRADDQQIALGRFDGQLVLLQTKDGKETGQPYPIKPKPPTLKRLEPSGAPRGKKSRMILEGEYLDQVSEISTNVTGMTAKLLSEGRTANRATIEIDIPDHAAVGFTQLKLIGPGGTSAALPFAIDRYPSVNDQEGNDSARTGKLVPIPTTIVGRLQKTGDLDYFRFTARDGEEIAIQLYSNTPTTKFEPVLELTDQTGKVLAESTTGLLAFRFPRSGTYSLGIHDRDFRGGEELAYRVAIGRFPIVTSVYPSGLQRGTEGTLELRGVHLGKQPTVRLKVPADAAPGTMIPVPLVDVDGEKPLGEPKIRVGAFPGFVRTNMVSDTPTKPFPIPITFHGVLDQAEKKDHYRFTAKKGQTIIAEVHARAVGSPVDSFIEILDDAGKPVPRATLRCVARTFSTFRDNDSTTPGIRLEYWNELSIDDYLYVNGELMRIKQLPKNPDDDCQFYQVDGQRVGYLGTTPTHHSNGSPMYKVEIHPPGSRFPPNGMPLFSLYYRNDDGGPGFGKDSRLVFVAPTDGTFQIRISDSRGSFGPDYIYQLTLREPKPDFSVRFTPTEPSVWRNGSIPINVTAKRIDDFDGPIHVQFANLPPGFTAPPTIIEAGQTTTTFPLFAQSDAKVPNPRTTLRLVATATIADQSLVREATGVSPTVQEPGDIITSVDVQDLPIRPGQETRFRVKVERRNQFKGRIPLEVRGLPHGVRVLNIGLNGILITERDTEREVVVYAEPWVKPIECPIIVLARREGKNTEHGAAPVILKVK